MTEIQAFMLEVCFYSLISMITSAVVCSLVVFFSDIVGFFKSRREKRRKKKQTENSDRNKG